MSQQVRGVVSLAKGAPVSIETITVPALRHLYEIEPITSFPMLLLYIFLNPLLIISIGDSKVINIQGV